MNKCNTVLYIASENKTPNQSKSKTALRCDTVVGNEDLNIKKTIEKLLY